MNNDFSNEHEVMRLQDQVDRLKRQVDVLRDALAKCNSLGHELHDVVFRHPLPRSADNPVKPIDYGTILELTQKICSNSKV